MFSLFIIIIPTLFQPLAGGWWYDRPKFTKLWQKLAKAKTDHANIEISFVWISYLPGKKYEAPVPSRNFVKKNVFAKKATQLPITVLGEGASGRNSNFDTSLPVVSTRYLRLPPRAEEYRNSTIVHLKPSTCKAPTAAKIIKCNAML